jgi:predicted amidohydrolase YtcJ
MGATGAAAARGNLTPLKELFAYRSTYRSGRIYTPHLRMDTGILSRRLAQLATHGVRPRIHAVGNHAASCVCASLTDTTLRNVTVEHLTFLGDREIDAVAATGALASLQPGFIERFGTSILDRRLVPDLHACPAASLLRAGVPLALSSDNPCGPLDPLRWTSRAWREPRRRNLDRWPARLVDAELRRTCMTRRTRALRHRDGNGLRTAN